MKCEMCGKKSGIIYATKEHGLICGNCERKVINSEKEKQKEIDAIIEMYRKYGRKLDV